MSQGNSSQMRQIEEEAQYFQNIQSPSYEFQKNLFVNQHQHELSKSQLQKLMKEVQSHAKQDAFQNNNLKKDVYSLLTPLQAAEEFQQIESQNESSLEQQEDQMNCKEKQKNLLDEMLLPFTLIQGKCYYQMYPEILHPKDLMKTFEQESSENIEAAQNEKRLQIKNNHINQQLQDFIKIVNSYHNFGQVLDIATNFHRIKYGEHLPKIYQSMLWILKKEGKKMESALEEQVNCLKLKMAQLQSPKQEAYQFNPFIQNFNSQRLNHVQLIRQSAQQNIFQRKSRQQDQNGSKFEESYS